MRTDRMKPPSAAVMLAELLDEYQKYGTLLGITPSHVASQLIGPAAGPHTQLAGNIIAAWAGGARFFELKTVQTLDGEDLPVEKPCIYAPDECYNVEWSTELTVAEAQAEYIKAYYLLHLLSKELNTPDAEFTFNMSVGYDLAGISSSKIDGYLEGMRDASATAVWQECRRAAQALLPRFCRVDQAFLDQIPPCVSSSVTLSTLHGCPSQEIERIAAYLLTEKGFTTYIKCNPTLLGFEQARRTVDALGYDYLVFDDHHFCEDLQFEDAVPLLGRLRLQAMERGLGFGVKLTNTMPVTIDAGQLPGEEMYMSGRALFPLSLQVAAMISRAFEGRMPISFSGGVDTHNAAALLATGIKPLTCATTLLKPGGYARLEQLAQLAKQSVSPADVDTAALERMVKDVIDDPYYRKPAKIAPAKRITGAPPLFDCFTAPCSHACPLNQDVPAYLAALAAGDKQQAARIVLMRNPLPNITGTICPHPCMNSCNRRNMDVAVDVRGCKLSAAEVAMQVNREFIPLQDCGKRAAVIGAGPAGLAAAVFLRRGGWQVRIFERDSQAGGVVRRLIPDFRIAQKVIDADLALVEQSGVQIEYNCPVDNLAELAADYEAVVVAVGAEESQTLHLEQGEAIPAAQLLAQLKSGDQVFLGKRVCVVGGGNTAMDTARAVQQVEGVEEVSIVYRRDRRNMPADVEELEQAEAQGIRFHSLLQPLALANGKLRCEVMQLGEPDADGRRKPEPIGMLTELPCDTLIAALGSGVAADWFNANGLTLSSRLLPQLDADNCSRDNIYVVGDAAHGAATVVEAVAAAGRVARAICGVELDRFSAENSIYHGLAQRGITDYDASQAPARCLECGGLCGLCIEVCPNRANRFVRLTDGSNQVVHFDALCNECGNCALFCPYDGKPYKDKLTVYADEESFRAGTNPGFVLNGVGHCLLRCHGVLRELRWQEEAGPEIATLIEKLRPYCC